MNAPAPASDRLQAAVRRAQARRRGWAGHGIARHLALAGSLGAAVLLPIAAGLALGWQIDRARGGGAAGRLGLLLAGAALGLWWAWRTMERARPGSDQDKEDPP
jgi:ATP synthase protein I